jgi:hypothetical protein
MRSYNTCLGTFKSSCQDSSNNNRKGICPLLLVEGKITTYGEREEYFRTKMSCVGTYYVLFFKKRAVT